MEITAYFYDGRTSQRKEVRVHFDPGGQLRITGLENDLTYPLSEVRVSPRVGNTPRSIYLPGDAKCEALDNDTIDAILRRQGKGKWQAFIHKLESRLGYVLLLLILTAVGTWGLVEYGIPALAKRAAYALPQSAETALGQDALKVLDEVLFSPSDLQEDRQSQLRVLFADLTRGLDQEHHFRLEFRKSDRVGPNAFALPSGIIVITDELILLSEHQNELIAVLAHEIGHVVNRHALRTLLQRSVVALVIVSVTGDIASIKALSAAVPTMLLNAKYSRTFENEADMFALQFLRAHKISPRYFAEILLRLEKEKGHDATPHNYLTSHPATSERLKMFDGSLP